MADTKISDLTEHTTAPAATDEFVLVDKSDTTMAASGTDKRIQFSNLYPLTSAGAFVAGGVASAPASSVVGVAETYYAVQLTLPAPRTIVGIRYRVGAVSSGNVRVALFASDATTKLADVTGTIAQGATGVVHAVNFDSTYAASPGIYLGVLWFSSAAATWVGGRYLVPVRTGTSAGATPTSLAAAATTNADWPLMIGI